MPASSNGSLILPLVVWNSKTPPECDISSLIVSETEKYIYTGTTSGHIIMWEFHVDDVRVVFSFSHQQQVSFYLISYSQRILFCCCCCLASKIGETSVPAHRPHGCGQLLGKGRLLEGRRAPGELQREWVTVLSFMFPCFPVYIFLLLFFNMSLTGVCV